MDFSPVFLAMGCSAERGESGLYSKLVKLQANVQVTVPEEPNFSSELGASLSRQVSKSSKWVILNTNQQHTSC
jgi:hypothetical protein